MLEGELEFLFAPDIKNLGGLVEGAGDNVVLVSTEHIESPDVPSMGILDVIDDPPPYIIEEIDDLKRPG